MSSSQGAPRLDAVAASRRGFLKDILGAAASTSLLYAGPDAVLAQLGPLPPLGETSADQSVKTVLTFHDVHCHGACILKAYIKQGRLLKLTSAGDVPRADSASDESIGQMQRRACIKGFAERKRLYSPDRIKYPLKQTGERGDLNSFRRISWDQAIDEVCASVNRVRDRAKSLG